MTAIRAASGFVPRAVGDVCSRQPTGNNPRMTDALEEEVAQLTGEAVEQDESGAPEKVARTQDSVPLESRDGDEDEQDRAPQPGLTPAPDNNGPQRT